MEVQGNQDGPRKGFSKGIMISILVAFLIIGGGVAAYVSINNPSSDKQKYFLAEKNSYDFLYETITERYKPEIDWMKLAEKEPTEANIKLSAEYNGPSVGELSDIGIDPTEVINSSALTLKTQTDMANKKVGLEVTADIAGIVIENINFYLTDEKLMLGLPFLNEILQVKAEDTANLLNELIPEYEAEEEIDFGSFFENSRELFSEEDKEHFKENYFDMVYEALTDDDFTSSKEKISVHGESVDTEKIVLHLDEEKVKDIFARIFDQLAQDEVVKELIEKQFTNQFLGLTDESLIDTQEIDKVINDFEESMLIAKAEIQDGSIPNGFTSTIWIHNKLIVQREFSLEMGPSPDLLSKITIEGTQLFTDEKISFAYDFHFEDNIDQGTLTLTGDSVTNDDQITDSLKIVVADAEFTYNGEETVKDGTREFEREFSISEPAMGYGTLFWSGDSSYEKDQMNAVHEFSIAAPGLDRDLFSLHAVIDGKQIREVNIPEENIKDLGGMSVDEITKYIEEDATIQFQKWLMGIMIDAGAGFGF